MAASARGTVRMLKWGSFADEAAGLARLVSKRLSEGVAPAEMYIACAGRPFASGILEALADRKVGARWFDPDTRPGSGEMDAGSLAVLEALVDAVEGSHKDVAASKLSRLRGFGLVNALGRIDPSKSFHAFLGDVEGDESAWDLLQRMRSQPSTARSDTSETDTVRVGLPRHIPALSPNMVVLAGFVKGGLFVGGAEDASLLLPCLGGACREIVFSSFSSVDEATAHELGLPLGRRCVVRGRTAVAVSRSPLVALFGDALPGSVSGELYLR